jgi:hypothetical protein
VARSTANIMKVYFNNRFWEELIAYFPWYDTGHIDNDESNNSFIVACVFVTAVTFLPCRCLATIGGYTDTHRQPCDLISLFLFFQNKESGPKVRRNPFFIFIHSSKYINIFLSLHMKCARKCSYMLQCVADQKGLRTTALRYREVLGNAMWI